MSSRDLESTFVVTARGELPKISMAMRMVILEPPFPLSVGSSFEVLPWVLTCLSMAVTCHSEDSNCSDPVPPVNQA